MIRCFVVAATLACLVASAWAQSQSPTNDAAAPAAKPAAKKQPPRNKLAAITPLSSSSCQLGVIPVLGDTFGVQKIGITVFGNEYTEVPIEVWGLDDLVVTRVRAAARPGLHVKRIAYTKGAFDPIDHPARKLVPTTRDDLITIVRQIAAHAGCERYIVVTKSTYQLANTNQTNRGVGVMTSNSLLGHPILFAYFDVFIFDGRTFEIAKPPALDLADRLLEPFRPGDPRAALENSAFPDPASEAANSQVLREHTRDVLAAKLDKYLPLYLQPEQL